MIDWFLTSTVEQVKFDWEVWPSKITELMCRSWPISEMKDNVRDGYL